MWRTMLPIAAVALSCGALRAQAPAAGRTLVVDSASPQADDAGPGTEEKPWKTIAQAARAAKPGDTVCVMEGNYPERVKLAASGTKDRWITFQAVPPLGVRMQGFHTGGQSYVRIAGFDISHTSHFYPGREGDYEGGIQIAGSHIEATDNYIHDLACAVHGVDAKDIRLAYNRLYKCQQCLLITGENWTVENNEISRVIQYTKSDGDYCRGWGKGHVLRYNRLHGTRKFVSPGEVNEVPTAHLDCFQTWVQKPYHLLQDFTFENNMCEVFSQGCMIERDKKMDPNQLARLTFRRNIYWHGGNWGLCMGGIKDVDVENNTFAKIGLYGVGMGSSTGLRTNNLCVDVHADKRKPWRDDANKDIDVPEPRLVDEGAGNFRLRKDSPLIGAGAGGVTPGALEYPNVYYVDPRHSGADDNGFGYPGWPLKTVVKALAIAQEGETVVLRGGTYRQAIEAGKPGVTIRAMKGEKVVLSGADLIEGWKRDGDRWAAPLPAAPKTVLRDAAAWTDFTYDAAGKRILVKGADPRLHVFETVVRPHALDLGGKKVRVEDVAIVNVPGAPVAGAGAAELVNVTFGGKPVSKD